MSEPMHLRDSARPLRGLPPSPPAGWWRTVIAVPVFLVMLLAAYGMARGLAQALAPLDVWLETHIVRPAAEHGSSGRSDNQMAEVTGSLRQDGP